jgi:N-acetylglucosamine-6-sulfatase
MMQFRASANNLTNILFYRVMTTKRKSCLFFRALLIAVGMLAAVPLAGDEEKPWNVLVIFSDDHRHDFIEGRPGCPPFLQTPGLKRLAEEGVVFTNSFVSTSLCSPSRATLLTGQYMHRHRVVDNQRPEPDGIRFFPEFLQETGFETAFVGKWHMGHDSDEKRKGFDYWAAFKGQGDYENPQINFNGERKDLPGYSADVLGGIASDWLKNRNQEKPFYLQVAFKNVHFPFQPSARVKGKYRAEKVIRPPTMAFTEENYATQPRWVKERRFGIHGVDHMEAGPFDNDPVPDFDDFFHDYCETVHSMDNAIDAILTTLDSLGLAKNTIVIYTSDNGFHLGEHGFYDKRDAYETSMRVPLIIRAPGRFPAGKELPQLVQNIDLAPSILAMAGSSAPEDVKMDGASFLPLLEGREIKWREHLLYEYHWEWNFPATPTLFAIRTARYKYISHHGIWDKDAFFDLETDPLERHNLIDVPAFREQALAFRAQLYEELGASGGLIIPVPPPAGEPLHDRKLP